MPKINQIVILNKQGINTRRIKGGYMTMYTSVKLPKTLAKQINEITETGGYRSVSDFVLEATRSHLREVRG